jgi:putative tryptophan/tyrosine transport system substrate-binding protein
VIAAGQLAINSGKRAAMRYKVLAFLLIILTAHLADAQQKNIPRIGYLATVSRSAIRDRYEAFHQGLRDHGYSPGTNAILQSRFADGKPERLAELAAELIALKVDVLVTSGPPSTRAARKASTTIPIVMAEDPDPVASGLVSSLARPGGNITGLSTLSPEIGGKRLEILKELLPKLSRIAILGTVKKETRHELENAAKALGIHLEYHEIQDPKEIEPVFREAIQARAEAILVLENPVIISQRGLVIDYAAKIRLPAIYPWPEFVDQGGLITYTASRTDLFRRAASYVDKILKGAKPAELPVEQPTKFELVINLKTAKQIGLTIPPEVLARANKLIK